MGGTTFRNPPPVLGRPQMSTMDSEECWGEPSGCQEDYDCGPDSGLLLPAVYSVDPGQASIHAWSMHTVRPTFGDAVQHPLPSPPRGLCFGGWNFPVNEGDPGSRHTASKRDRCGIFKNMPVCTADLPWCGENWVQIVHSRACYVLTVTLRVIVAHTSTVDS